MPLFLSPLVVIALLVEPALAAEPDRFAATEAQIDDLYARAVAAQAAARDGAAGTVATARTAWARYADALEAAQPTTPGLQTEDDDFRHAQALALAGRTERALPALDAIASERSGSCRRGGPTCAEDARRLAWQTRRDRVIAEVGGDTLTPGFTLAKDSLYPVAIGTPKVATTSVGADGTTLRRFELPAAAADLIRDTDTLLMYPFVYPEVRARVASERASLQLQAGQLLFAYGHMAEARERLIQIVEAAPSTEEARIAANLYLESTRREGGSPSVTLAAQEVATRMGASSPGAAAYADLAAATAFKAIESRDPLFGAPPRPDAPPAERIETARAYVAFADAQPAGGRGVSGSATEIALGRAASLLVDAHASREAVATLERFLTAYPNSPHALGLTWQLAVTASRTLDIPKALAAYDSFAALAKRPTMQDEARRLWEARVDPAHAMLYSAALREVQGDPRDAARAWERYATTHAPAKADTARGLLGAEEALWRAGWSWRRAGDSDALAFAKRYVARASTQTDPGHLVLAWDLIAQLEAKRGNATGAKDAEAVRTRSYDQARAAGTPLPRSVHHAGLGGARKALEAVWAANSTDPWTDSERSNLDRLVTGKGGRHGVIALVEVDAVTRAASPLIESPDYVSQQMGGYYAGLAWARHAALLRVERPSPLLLGRAYPLALSTGQNELAISPDSVEYEMLVGVLRDGDVEADGKPEFVGAEEAESRAERQLADTVRQAGVSMEPGAPHWSDWTARALEVLDVELRSTTLRRDRAIGIGGTTAPQGAATGQAALTAAREALAGSADDAALVTAARAALEARQPMLALMALSGVDTRASVTARERARVSALRGEAQALLGERLAAGFQFEEALALDAQEPVALRGQLALALADRDYRRALPLAERLHLLAPDDDGVLLQLAAAQLGETQRAWRDGASADAGARGVIAQATLERARARLPGEPDVHRNLAILHTSTALASALPTDALKAAQVSLQLYETTAAAASRTLDTRELADWRADLERHARRVALRAARAGDAAAASACATLAEKAAPRMRGCLEAARARGAATTGTVRATWQVLEGDARETSVLANTSGDAELAACVTRTVESWTFGDATCSMTWEWTLTAPAAPAAPR